MKPNDIDKLDKKRYNALKLLTVGLVVLVTAMAIAELTLRASYPLIALGLAGMVILTISIYGLISVMLKIKADPALKEALYDELYRSHAYKAFQRGFWAMYAVLFFFICTSSLYHISVRFACILILFVGFFTLIVSFLKLQQEKK